MKEIKLPTGATLKIGDTPFAVSKALYKAVVSEMKGVELSSKREFNSLIKDVFCTAFSSEKVETALAECLARCTYNDVKIDEKTFDGQKAREDYVQVCIEVAIENLTPFMKGLYAGFERASAMILENPK